MVSSVEQKVEYLDKLLNSNNETTKTIKDNLERLDVFFFSFLFSLLFIIFIY